MIEIFNTLLYQPIFNLLIFFYNIVPGNDVGLAIIALTLVVKGALLPFGLKSLKSQKALQDIQPKIDELKKKYKDDKEKLAAETMKIYKEQQVNPFSSCLPLLIQFPFLIAVYRAFRTGLASADLDLLYSFIHNPGTINSVSFNLIDLAVPSIILAIIAGAAQFIQVKMMSTAQPKKITKDSKDESMLASMNQNMKFFMPVMTIFIGIRLPAGLALYWIITTLLTTLQQKLLFNKSKKDTTKLLEGTATTVK